MSNNVTGVKISQFNVDTSITDTSLIPFVDNGANKTITYTNLKNGLGVTGTIKPTGGSTSLPVLSQPASTVNYIRNLLGSQGISTTTAPTGEIAIKTNFANAAGGTAQLISDPTAAQIKFRSLIAGDGITLEQDANNITLSANTATLTSNTVVVENEEDFPTPISGVITLADNTEYFIANDIATSNRFVLGSSTVISSADPFTTTLSYTGSGVMFTFGNGLAGIKEIGLSCANGTLLDTSGVTSGNLLMRWLLIRNVNNLGSVNSNTVGIYNVFIQLHTGQGFTVSAVSNRRLNIANVIVASTTSATSTFINLDGATFDALNIDLVTFLSTVSGQVFLSGAAGGANISNSSIGYVSKVTIIGDMVGLDTITTSDAKWDFTDNNKISDTRPIALLDLSATATTTISALNTPVIVNGTFTDEQSSLFTVSAAGRATYNGVRTLSTDITATVTFTSSSGTNNYTFYIAKNGTVITNSGVTREVVAASNANISLIWDLPLETGDYIEIYVENNDNDNDVSVSSLIMRVK